MKRLYIDLDKCDQCDKCSVRCSYFYRTTMADHGVLALRELAQFALVCRRCEDPCCAAACRFSALERQEDGVMKRYNMRCVSCKCCSQACPFGTIYPDTVPFYVANCDLCVSSGGKEPPCAISCVNKAIEYRDIEPSDKDGMYALNDTLVVRAPKWNKNNV